jgi:pimeloyl-ACP methyl ester carboxylesterase
VDTNDLLHRWSTLSLAEIEAQIQNGTDLETVTQLLGADTVAEIQQISFAAPMVGEREDVVLLPGIMGSLLASIRGVTTLLWINPLLFLQGNGRYLRLNEAGTQDEDPNIEGVPLGLEKLTYLKISLKFNKQFNLHEFPYDWRRPIEVSADALDTSLEKWAGGDPNRKFTLVGHSMGGLVSRAYMARHPKNAEKRIKRLIMHGTPNFGATNAVDSLLNGNSMMATVDKLNAQNEMRQLVYCLPSVYQLLPAPPDCFPTGRAYPVNFDFYQAASWKLPVVKQKYLDGANLLHHVLAASDPQIPMVEIAGVNIETLVGIDADTSKPGLHLITKVVAEGENSGDGTVPLWSAMYPKATMYFIQEVHRKLPGNNQVIDATMELIQSGTCGLPKTLPKSKPTFFAPQVPFDVQAEDLRAKIENGQAGEQDLEKLFINI